MSPESSVVMLSFPPPPRTTSATLPIFVTRNCSHGCFIEIFGTVIASSVQVYPLTLDVLPHPTFQIQHIPKLKTTTPRAGRKEPIGRCFQSA